MKGIGYITVFILLVVGAYQLANGAYQYNVGLALFLGMLIPIIMVIAAGINGDWD